MTGGVLTEREKTFHRSRDHASEHKARVHPYVSVCQLRFVQELDAIFLGCYRNMGSAANGWHAVSESCFTRVVNLCSLACQLRVQSSPEPTQSNVTL